MNMITQSWCVCVCCHFTPLWLVSFQPLRVAICFNTFLHLSRSEYFRCRLALHPLSKIILITWIRVFFLFFSLAPLYLTWSSTQFIIKNEYSNLPFVLSLQSFFFASISPFAIFPHPECSLLVYCSCHDKEEFMSRLQSYVLFSSCTFFLLLLISNIFVERRKEYRRISDALGVVCIFEQSVRACILSYFSSLFLILYSWTIIFSIYADGNICCQKF